MKPGRLSAYSEEGSFNFRYVPFFYASSFTTKKDSNFRTKYLTVIYLFSVHLCGAGFVREALIRATVAGNKA